MIDKELLHILTLTENQLFDYLLNQFSNDQNIVYNRDRYIARIKDEKLPFLVAHIDTVYAQKPELSEIIISGNLIRSKIPKGIGGDDRCGVYALLKLSHLDVNLLFCNYEEKGCSGSKAFCDDYKDLKPIYFIGLDRKNRGECVFYNSEEKYAKEFYNIVTSLFKVEKGKGSDVKVLGKFYKVASTNLSVGFFNPHDKNSEYIDVDALNETIALVPVLLDKLGKKCYELKYY